MASAPSEPRARRRTARPGRPPVAADPAARIAPARGGIEPGTAACAAADRRRRRACARSWHCRHPSGGRRFGRPRHRAVGRGDARRRRHPSVAARLDRAAVGGPRLAALLGGVAEAEVGRGAQRMGGRRGAAGDFAFARSLPSISASTSTDAAGQPLTRAMRLIEDEHGEMPLISALAGRRAFTGQKASSRADESRTLVLSGEVVAAADGRVRRLPRYGADRPARAGSDGAVSGAAPISIMPSKTCCARRSTGSSTAPSASWSAPTARCAATMQATATILPPPRGTCCRWCAR